MAGTIGAGRVVLGGVLRSGPGGISASRIRTAGAVLLTAHLLAVGWLTLRPRSVAWVAPSNLHPLATIRADLAEGPQAALEGLSGGLLLLVPLGVLLPLAAGWLHRPSADTALRTFLAGTLISFAIPLLQGGVLGRTVNVDTILLNTAGVCLAHLLLFPPLRAQLRSRVRSRVRDGTRVPGTQWEAAPEAGAGLAPRDENPQAPTPRSSRVGITP